jgi:hypothetical protein
MKPCGCQARCMFFRVPWFSSFFDTMTLTWAEDRATLASDPSAVPGAKTEGAARCRPISFGIGTNARNASLQLSFVQAVALDTKTTAACHRHAASQRDALDYSSSGACRCPVIGLNLPRRPMHLDTPRRPFVRTSSPDNSGSLRYPARHGGSPKLRADVTGPCASISAVSSLGHGAWLAELPALANDQSAAEAVAAANGSRHLALSRNIAQQRTSSLRARATMACFLRVLPPCVKRWYTARAQAL